MNYPRPLKGRSSRLPDTSVSVCFFLATWNLEQASRLPLPIALTLVPWFLYLVPFRVIFTN
jgi:hypothetical protein